jgi:hypothetical protein
MRLKYNFSITPVGLFILLGFLLTERTHAQSAEVWIESRPFLAESQNPQSPQGFLWVESLYSAMTRSLANPEQHKQLADLQNRTGSKPQAARLHSLSIHQNTALLATAAPGDVSRSLSNFLGREFKTSAMPDSLRKGFSFTLGGASSGIPAAAPSPVRYGLIVTGLEPNPESFRLASLPRQFHDEYALVPYAPKAKIHYKVGPLPADSVLQSTSPAAPQINPSSFFSQLPDWQFRAKIASRGAPTASQILPPQALTLEQTQGFYTMELQTSQLLRKDAMFHRFRLPLTGNMNFREERNDKLQKTRSTLENIYSHGPLALNLDYFGNEKRYQTGLIFQKTLTRIELYNHLPESLGPSSSLWNQQRWELKLQKAF